MRRSISAVMIALAVGVAGPASGAAASGRPHATPQLQKYGVRIVDIPLSEARDPRALRYIIDDLPTGTVIHRRILILNEETRTVRLTVYPDAAHITRGLFIGYSGQSGNELTRWISVQHRVVTLAPGKSVMDMVTIKVPRGATRGEHYGDVWVQQRAKAPTTSRFGVIEISRVGIRVYLAVGQGGLLPTRFAITSITGHRLGNGRLALVAHVANTGGRAVDLSGSARLDDGPGNSRSGPFPAQQIVTLAPGQSGNVTFGPPKNLPVGSWRATVTLASGLTTATATATIQFASGAATQAGLSAMQLIWLALGGLVLALVIVMGGYALQHRRGGLRPDRWGVDGQAGRPFRPPGAAAGPGA